MKKAEMFQASVDARRSKDDFCSYEKRIAEEMILIEAEPSIWDDPR